MHFLSPVYSQSLNSIQPLSKIVVLIAFALSPYSETTALGVSGLELHSALDAVLNGDSTARRTTVALKVVDLTTDAVLYDRHGDRLFTPASNLKIYTSACALDLFGPDHCFPTKISARVDAKSRAIQGNLRLVGGGNAMLSSPELRQLADRIVAEWAVDALQGAVQVDNSRYGNIGLGPGWMWDDEPYYFNMRITPLMVDFNVLKARVFTSNEGKVTAQLDPVAQVPLLRLVAEKQRHDGWRAVRSPTEDAILVVGAGKLDHPIEARIAVKDPSTWVRSVFTEMLRARGVCIGPALATAEPSSSAVEQSIVYRGSKLSATLKHFNHVSENAVGEVLLHEIAIANGKLRPTWSDGAERITSWLHEAAGLEPGSFQLVDGSGLSRYNLISADSSVRLLSYMRQHRHYATFLEALPVYEVESSRTKNKRLVHAKSGGMSGVSTISGYVQTVEGRQLAFSLLSNGFIGTSKPAQALRGKVWRLLVQYRAGDSE